MIAALLVAVFFMIALQIRIVILQRRLLEEFRLRKPRMDSADGLTVKISCDTSDFDIALKNTTERAQIICAAFESALRVGVEAMNEQTRKTNAQIQREMQDRQFAATHALEIRRWHRDVARQIFQDQIRIESESRAIDDVKLHAIAVESVRAADFLLSAIMAKPAAADPPKEGGE